MNPDPAPAPAPGGPPADPTPAPVPDPTPTPAPGQDPSAPIDFDTLPANVRNYIANLRTENGKHRTDKQAATAQAEQSQQQLAKVMAAIGLKPDGSKLDDPAAAAEQLRQRAQQAEDAAWAQATQLGLYRAAAKHGADYDRLRDSMSFVDTLDDVDAAPGTGEFTAAIEGKVSAWLTAHPEFKGTPAAPARSGGDFPGAPGGTTPITEEQLDRMTPQEIDAAWKAGKLKHLM